MNPKDGKNRTVPRGIMTKTMQLILHLSNPAVKAFIAICLLVIGNGLVPNVCGASDDDNSDAAALDGLHLDQKIQQRAGLQITLLKPFQYAPEFSAYGNALPLQPLLDLRNRHMAALAQYESALARLALAQQNIDRTQYLQRNGIASQRALQEQQSQLRMEKAQTEALRLQIKAIYNEALLNWGQKLADLFLSADATRLTPYLSGQKTLLLITLSAGQTLADGIKRIAVSPSGERGKAHPAEFISIAPQTDAITQGESYFFATDYPTIRTGMRIAAWLPQQQSHESGVLIPASALIWHLGQAFVYLKTGAERFSRRRIAHFVNTPEGYFIRDTLAPGEKLVTVGAQMLLSEEFRGQIPDEDDD